ncbi:MAG: hypothetical protein LQ347_006370 [Umbilicaria vellea]|nr:MAG: hypothetical protein LQ347_006370 [Umbilicaria vellea]
MRFTSTLLLAAIAAVAQAGTFSIENLPDGGYILSLDSDGNQVNETIHPSSVKVPRASRLAPRGPLPPLVKTTCRADGNYDHNSMVTSRNQLGAFCDSGHYINGGSSVVFVNSNAIYYACSNGGRNFCSSAEIAQANSIMDGTCGAWTDVNLYIPGWAKTYGRDTLGNIC